MWQSRSHMALILSILEDYTAELSEGIGENVQEYFAQHEKFISQQSVNNLLICYNERVTFSFVDRYRVG